MAWIDTISGEDAPEELRELYRRVTDPGTGQLDHIMQIHSLHPEGLRAQVVCLRAELRHIEREGERAQRLREDAAERKDRMVQEVLEREQSLREELASLLEEQADP